MPTTTAPDGTSIAYDDHGGDGPAVVLVHGITESRGNWDPIVERLRGGHRVITLDLRGHGSSGDADDYGLEAMAGDVATVIAATGVERPHLVGHSLGGMVCSVAGAALPVASVTNVDQSLQLAAFKDQVAPLEPQLRNEAAFPLVIDGLFGQMRGAVPDDEWDRVQGHRRPSAEVVLGVWGLLFTTPVSEIAAIVDGALAGYAGSDVPYLSLHGVDPGDGYADWLAARIPGAETEVWPDLGHYPHLVHPDRFVDRLRSFWG